MKKCPSQLFRCYFVYLNQGPDEEAGDDGEEGAGDQLQEEAVEPDIEFV